jgi:hypothetical protein
MLEHLAEITAIDPATARGAPNEMLGLARRPLAKPHPHVLAARNGGHQGAALGAKVGA